MQTDNWEKVKNLLDEVLSIEPSKRSIFLKESAVSDYVKAEIESLMAFETEAENLMNLSAIEFSKDFFSEEDSPNSLLGQQIGTYRVIREIGHGGMGAVYLAERNYGKFEQKVALKMLKREMNTSAIRRRFRHEGEILASLEHPNIARLLDTGTTDDKTPYLAMEYVEGLPIDEYCRKNTLDLNGRLDLFRQVCGAVNFAHRNLIVHRDLKPSNILVTNEGIPKLLDFGISKILSSEIEQINSATVTRLGAMTPSYASPEQLQRKSVTTATDIYSLGVILYELLCGHRPFEEKEENLKDIFQAVLESEPPFPSSVLEKDLGKFKTFSKKEIELPESIDELPTIPLALENNTTPIKSTHTKSEQYFLTSGSLRGDLDNIVMKALRKEPERRYSSADNFAEDLHRHQRGLPVTARPNTFMYRAEKFVQRNSLSVSVGILFFLALIGGIVATMWQSKIAQYEREKAEKRFNDVRTLANSFLFDFSPLIENLPGSTPARELLVKKALEYLDNLSRETGEDLELQLELAAAYQKVGDVQGHPYNPNIGDTKGAFESYEKSLSIRQKLVNASPNDLRFQEELSNIYKLIADLHSNGGDITKSAENYDASLKILEKLVELNPQDFELKAKLASILRIRGLVPFYDGENKKAIEYYVKSQNIFGELIKLRPEDSKIAEEYAFTFVSIGEAQGWDNDFQSAAINLQKGLDLLLPLSEVYPNDTKIQRSLMLAYNKRAENFQDLEDFDKSVEMFRKSIVLANKNLAADPQNFLAKRDVAMTYKKLAQALDDAGKSNESLEKLSLAINIFQEMSRLDPKNTEYPYDVANTRHSLGITYQSMKNFEKAKETYLQSKSEFDAILLRTPENVYTIRMSSYNLDRLAKTYLSLAEINNSQTYLLNAIDSFNNALVGFKKLKADGNLGEVDSNIIGEIEKEIVKIKAKMNK